MRLGDWLADLAGRFSSADVTIRVRPGRPVDVRGPVARAKASGIAGFFGRELAPARALTVRGTRIGGAWRWRISGGLSPADRQRVLNFLTNHLR